MTARRPGSIAAAAVAAVLAIGALAGCDPVASEPRTPGDRASESRAAPATPAPTPSPTPTGDATCARAATAQPGKRVALDSLPGRSSFTQTVAAARGRVVAAGDTTIAFHDFTPSAADGAAKSGTVDGGVLGPAAAGLVGAGVDRTTIEVAAHTSTRAADIPTTFPNTNQLDVLRVVGAADLLRGFTVRGTGQGHLYNGLRIDQVRNLRASDIRVTGIPGDDSKPPGETFGINDFKTVGSVWSGIEVDGAGVGASGFGVNGSRDITLCDTVSHDNRFAMGFAFWQSSGIRLVDCAATDNGFSGFNFERVSGTNTLIRPVASGNRYDMRIATDRASAKYRIVDPQLHDGTWTVTLPKRWYGTTNKQRRSDITLIVDGRSRPDLLRFVSY